MCEVMMDLAQGRKNDAAQRAKENEARTEESMGRHDAMDQILAVSKTQAEIDLLERQIEVLQRKLNKAVDPDEKAKYENGILRCEQQLDMLLLQH